MTDKTPRQVRLDIIAECKKQGLLMPEQHAYVLATVQHETNLVWKPVKEAYWLSENWRRQNLRYYPYYGRGYVQLTWKENYRKYEVITGKPLVSQPDLVMEHELSTFILVHGFKNGTFTGRKLERYINEVKIDFVGARRCINGLDKAQEIASIARSWLRFV